MTDIATQAALRYFARIGAALFPIPAGAKAPTGIVASWKLDHSRDSAQWDRWAAENPGCNFGIVASASRLIIVDVDVSEVGRETAWTLYTDWCASHGLPVFAPYCQSARGGWHILFRLPDDAEPGNLTQRALIGPQPGFRKAVVDTRIEGFTVAAGSYYDGTAKGEASGAYLLFPDAPAPHPAPAALIAHCTRATTRPSTTAPIIGARDPAEVAGLVRWLTERDAFSSYEDWVGIGMALKLEFGDAGLDLWEIATWPDALDAARGKWESFATEPTSHSVTLNTWMKRAHELGWRGTLSRSASSMFADVVSQLAPPATGAMPMLDGQRVLCEQQEPTLRAFLADTADAPNRPANPDFPTLPEAARGHGLFDVLQSVIARIFALAETRNWKSSRVEYSLGTLLLVHAETAETVRRRLAAIGVPLNWRNVKLAATAQEDGVKRAIAQFDDWLLDGKGQIEHNNPDNIAIFLGILGCELRWNAWRERAEIRGFEWSDWTYIDDTVHAKLSTRAGRTGTRFLPSDTFLWRTLIALAVANTIDPAVDHLERLRESWDGIPRLSVWLSRACGVPCDIYYQVVGRNIIGGMVRRILHPGCKHDTMAVLYGPQGTGKSTLAAILADAGQSSLRAILSGEGQWFTDNVQLGDAAKELVLSLASTSVAELSEMGARRSAGIEHVKAMVSRQVDAGRPAYGRAVVSRPRRNIFIGTTNDAEPLSDAENRRFLPVPIERPIDLAWLHENIGQLVGEACTLESAGESFDLPREVWALAAERQSAARSVSDIEVKLSEWLGETDDPPTHRWSYITATDLIDLCESLRHPVAMRTAIMRKLGFRTERPYLGGSRVRVWVRGPKALPNWLEKEGVRFMVGVDAHGRPRVTRRAAPS